MATKAVREVVSASKSNMSDYDWDFNTPALTVLPATGRDSLFWPALTINCALANPSRLAKAEKIATIEIRSSLTTRTTNNRKLTNVTHGIVSGVEVFRIDGQCKETTV